MAKAGCRVLVLEAGGADEPDEYKVPAFHSLSTEHSQLAWKFYVQHYADKDLQRRDRRNFLDRQIVDGVPRHGIFYPRAGTLGGCTAHHAMIFVAPHDSDWDHIAKVTGDESWKVSLSLTLPKCKVSFAHIRVWPERADPNNNNCTTENFSKTPRAVSMSWWLSTSIQFRLFEEIEGPETCNKSALEDVWKAIPMKSGRLE